jgi:hypothetical protein
MQHEQGSLDVNPVSAFAFCRSRQDWRQPVRFFTNRACRLQYHHSSMRRRKLRFIAVMASHSKQHAALCGDIPLSMPLVKTDPLMAWAFAQRGETRTFHIDNNIMFQKCFF